MIGTINSLIAASGTTRNGTSTSTIAQDKNGGGWGKRWLLVEVLCGILPFVLVSYFFVV